MVQQANTTQEYLKANERLKQTVADRVNLEKISVATQRASADIAFGLANRLAGVHGTNSSSLAKRGQSNRLNILAMQTEYSLPGTSDERKRALFLGIRGGENERREMLQERGYGKSDSHILNDLRKEQNEKRLRDRFDARMRSTDGLLSVHRDMSGRVLSGIDALTGERRAPVAHLSRPDRSSGLSSTLMQVQTKQLAAQEAMKAGIEKVVQSLQRMETIWVPLQ